MSRRPAAVTQADIARAIRAAKQAGAAEVEVRVGGATILVRISPSSGPEITLEPGGEIVL
jgi:ABC-type molybdate transport system ATPase subunit